MSRVLITGGAGFLGSHLCDHFLARGHQVICMDNLSTGRVENIAHIKSSDFTFIEYDVTNYIYVKEPVDYILHFASPASPLDYLEMPIQTLKVGSLGTHKALGLALAKKAVFLLASTSEVYGDPEVHPQKEDYWGNVNPIGPRGVYDEAKRFAEAMTMAYHRYHRLPIRIARIFNTYGPRMRLKDGRAIPTLIAQALSSEEMTIFGSGQQTRSFCYIADMIKGLYSLLMSDQNEPVNLGNPDEWSISDLAGMIREMTGSESPVVHRSLPVDDPKVRQPDISRAGDALGWSPTVTLKEGLGLTIDYFRENLAQEGRSKKG